MASLENDTLTWGISAVVFVALCVIALILRRRVRRAYQVQLFLVIVAALWLFPLWHSAAKLANIALGADSWVMIGAAFLSNILGFTFYYRDALHRLKHARKYNEASGRLDRARGLWKMESPLRLDAPEKEEQEKAQLMSIARWGIAFAPAIGQLMANHEAQGRTFSALLLFVAAYGLVLTLAGGLAIVVEIKMLENELGKKLLVSD
jgi:hypothetical protein